MVSAQRLRAARALDTGPVMRVTSALMTTSVPHVIYFVKPRPPAVAMVSVTSQDSVYVTVSISQSHAQSTVWTLRRATVTVAAITLESAHARRQARAAVLGVEALGPISPGLSVLSASPITMVPTVIFSVILLQRAVGRAAAPPQGNASVWKTTTAQGVPYTAMLL